MIDSLSHIGDTFARLPFLFFIELVTTKRVSFIYDYWKFYSSELVSVCPSLFCPDGSFVSFSIAIAFVLCIFASVIYVKGILTVGFVLTQLLLLFTMFSNYMLLLNSILSPTLSSSLSFSLASLMQRHYILGCLLVMSSVLFISICSMFKRIPVHKFSAVIILYLFVLCIFSIPILINPLSSTIHQNNENCLLSATSSFKSLTIHTPNSAKISPAWLYYVYSMLKSNCCAKSVYSSSIDCNSRSICLRQSSVYPLSSTSSSLLSSSSLTDRDTVHQLFTIVSEYTCQHKTLLIVYSFILLCIYIILLVYCLYITEVYKSLKTSISQEIELCRLGVVDYLAFHWGRLNIAQILIYFWSFKIMSVVILGPLYWAVIPAVSYSGNFVNFSARPINSSTLMDYSNPDTGDYSTFSVLITRLYVGVFVHGSETWLSVFGAAAFFSALGTIFVSLLVFLLDPSGDRTAQLAVAAADAPADPNGWNVIEDPALALDQNDVIAFDLLASNGWHCAAVFLFFAFQSDMPNLQPVHRASCCMYGIVVILITCIHPVQALVKSFLLRLGIPGQQTNWSEHIRPLCFWIVLIFAAINIFTNLPKILVYERIEFNNSINNNNSNVNTPLITISSRLGSSEEAIRARQLRIYLIGCQLLLSLTVTLIEYSVYQYYRRCPDWRGFRPMLFWTKLISSVLDYLFSLLSFLSICWLLFYDSIGICRLFIICCYLFFVLYPSAHKAYSWIRWKLLFKNNLNNLSHPTSEDLQTFGDICPICYTEMTVTTAKITRCGHLYHINCLIEWMKRQFFCPMCHADLLSSKVTDRRNFSDRRNEE
uniref:RING-type domain-containing protein n=1 Tax=Trichobilharzia regenti TaxID=157069 RepID=A0AA85KNH0_TRIRE|nr:unnamed protein product [Trichobilharzia regenti]